MTVRRPIKRLLTDESGFATAAFSGLAFALGLIATAFLLASNAELRSANHDLRRDQLRFAMEGLVAVAELKLLNHDGAPTLVWDEPTAFGPMTVSVEPEFKKLAPGEAERPQNAPLFALLAGANDGPSLQHELFQLAPAADGVVHRSTIRELSPSVAWQSCILTFTSPFSRLSAINIARPETPSSEATATPHTGEIWRVTVDSAEGRALDTVVRFTGGAVTPVAVLEERLRHPDEWKETKCLGMLDQVAAPAAG